MTNKDMQAVSFVSYINHELSDEQKREIISLCNAAFPEPFDSLMDFIPPEGVHVLGYTPDGKPAVHALLTPRRFTIGGKLRLNAAYIDAVATHPDFQGRGYGSLVMKETMRIASESSDIGGLSTYIPQWYGNLGWIEWKGPLSLDKDGEIIPTLDVDGIVMVYIFKGTTVPDVHDTLTADWRPGGGW